MSTVLMEDFTSQSTYAYYQSANYTVIVRDKYGCTATAARFHILTSVSQITLPNGDGNLDDGLQDVRTIIQIYPSHFDRYGRVIAKYRIGQNGTVSTKEELPRRLLVYLKLNNNKDDREFVGHFTLYR
jgi:hypothetical protein